MSNKYFGGVVENKGIPMPVDDDLKAVVIGAKEKVESKMDALRVADALTEIMNIFRRANKYIDETMPWALAKDEAQKDRLATVLYNLTCAIMTGASLLKSFLPDTADKIAAQMGSPLKELDDCVLFDVAPCKVTETPQPLFARLDMKTLEPEIEKIIEEQIKSAQAAQPNKADKAAKAEKTEKTAKVAPMPEDKGEVASITIDDFAKVQLRVGEIIACEKVAKSDKLLHETVKFGDEVRSICSGIAKYYKPEELVGKKVVFVTNLPPRKMCGIVSEGMILAAEDEKGNMSLICPEKDVESGAEIG
jgi:methionyl-tRNA synthetase